MVSVAPCNGRCKPSPSDLELVDVFVDGGCSVVELEFDDSAEKGRQVRPGLSFQAMRASSSIRMIDSAVPSVLVIMKARARPLACCHFLGSVSIVDGTAVSALVVSVGAGFGTVPSTI